MKRLLITTALQETWGKEQDVLFLGDWCKLYQKKKEWGNRTHETIQYQGKDRKKFAEDNEYLVKLHEKLLSVVTNKLNEYHNTDYSSRYWNIIIGPWLSIFVPTIYERWENLKVAFEEHSFDEVFVSQPSLYEFAKTDYKESNSLFQEQEWNYQTYSDIILFQYEDSCIIKKINIKNIKKKLTLNKPKKSPKLIIKFLQRFIDNTLSKIQKNYKVIFISSYFDMKSLFKLSIKLRQLPRRYFQFDDDVFESKLKFKERIIKIDFSCDNDFERYLSTHLFKHIPYAYIEGYPNLKEISNKFNMYGRIIFTSNAHFSNDLFKVWCAEQVSNRGSKLFISLHGGAIPSLMSAFSRHEDMVSDKKIVWHKPLNQKQARLPPNKFLVKNKVRAKNNVDVTIVGLDLGLYSAGHQSGPRSSLILEDFKQKVDFIESVSISLQNKVKVFPYPHPGWDSRDKYIDLFGEGIISGNKVFNDAIYNSKIIVCTYPQTTFSAAIYSNVPVILLYVKKYWELRPEFDELLLIMMEANIIFSDATLASRHISNIYSTPNEWWESDKVVKARKLFNEYCLRTSDDWLNEWGEFFAKELN